MCKSLYTLKWWKDLIRVRIHRCSFIIPSKKKKGINSKTTKSVQSCKIIYNIFDDLRSKQQQKRTNIWIYTAYCKGMIWCVKDIYHLLQVHRNSPGFCSKGSSVEFSSLYLKHIHSPGGLCIRAHTHTHTVKDTHVKDRATGLCVCVVHPDRRVRLLKGWFVFVCVRNTSAEKDKHKPVRS